MRFSLNPRGQTEPTGSFQSKLRGSLCPQYKQLPFIQHTLGPSPTLWSGKALLHQLGVQNKVSLLFLFSPRLLYQECPFWLSKDLHPRSTGSIVEPRNKSCDCPLLRSYINCMDIPIAARGIKTLSLSLSSPSSSPSPSLHAQLHVISRTVPGSMWCGIIVSILQMHKLNFRGFGLSKITQKG